MPLEVTKFIDNDETISMIFHEDGCAYIVEGTELYDFEGNDVGMDAEIEISKENALAIEIDFNAKSGICFYKKFNCAEHAVEFCNRNLSGKVKIAYLLFALKWDDVDFYGEV